MSETRLERSAKRSSKKKATLGGSPPSFSLHKPLANPGKPLESKDPRRTEKKKTSDAIETRNYQVGYSRPPEQTRFRPGQSGNPSGRPKGTPNLASVLERALREKVIINENGRQLRVTKLEAAVTQLANKVAAGDLRAFNLMIGLVRLGEERSEGEDSIKTVLPEADKKVMLGIFKRLRASVMEVGC